MEKVILGRTDLEVSKLSLGTVFMPAGEEGRKLLRWAVEAGINYFDTAPGYGPAEERLGFALEGITEPVIISTKLGGRPTPFEPKDKDALRRSVEESLRLLKRDSIDLLLIHEPDRPRQYDWWTDRKRFYGPVSELLQELKSEGIIKFTGLGGTTAYEIANIMATGGYDVVLTAFNYSLLWREAEICVLPEAKRQNMGVIIGSPLQQGWLARRWDDEVEYGAPWLNLPRRNQLKALYKFVDEVGIPLQELALRWVLGNPDVHTILTGARNVQDLEQNINAINKGPLPGDIMKRLDEIAHMIPFRPFDEPFSCKFGTDYPGPGMPY